MRFYTFLKSCKNSHFFVQNYKNYMQIFVLTKINLHKILHKNNIMSFLKFKNYFYKFKIRIPKFKNINIHILRKIYFYIYFKI